MAGSPRANTDGVNAKLLEYSLQRLYHSEQLEKVAHLARGTWVQRWIPPQWQKQNLVAQAARAGEKSSKAALLAAAVASTATATGTGAPVAEEDGTAAREQQQDHFDGTLEIPGLHRPLFMDKETYKARGWCRRSLWVFSESSMSRRFCVKVLRSPWFERTILSLILGNAVMQLFIDYRDPHGFGTTFVESTEHIFTFCFLIEMVVKVVALGLILDRTAYLRDPWSWLDFLVVLSGLTSFFFSSLLDGSSGLNVIRTIRILRPLRGFSKLKGLRAIIKTFLLSLPRLGNVFGMFVFLIVIFGIVGLNFYGGTLGRHCRLTEEPVVMFSSSALLAASASGVSTEATWLRAYLQDSMNVGQLDGVASDGAAWYKAAGIPLLKHAIDIDVLASVEPVVGGGSVAAAGASFTAEEVQQLQPLQISTPIGFRNATSYDIGTAPASSSSTSTSSDNRVLGDSGPHLTVARTAAIAARYCAPGSECDHVTKTQRGLFVFWPLADGGAPLTARGEYTEDFEVGTCGGRNCPSADTSLLAGFTTFPAAKSASSSNTSSSSSYSVTLAYGSFQAHKERLASAASLSTSSSGPAASSSTAASSILSNATSHVLFPQNEEKTVSFCGSMLQEDIHYGYPTTLQRFLKQLPNRDRKAHADHAFMHFPRIGEKAKQHRHGSVVLTPHEFFTPNTKQYNFAVTHFDNLGGAVFAIFQSITLEGWVSIMYLYEDSYDKSFSQIYFFLLIVLGVFFILNVTLAIVFDAFSSLQEKTGVPNPLADAMGKDGGSEGGTSSDKLGETNGGGNGTGAEKHGSKERVTSPGPPVIGGQGSKNNTKQRAANLVAPTSNSAIASSTAPVGGPSGHGGGSSLSTKVVKTPENNVEAAGRPRVGSRDSVDSEQENPNAVVIVQGEHNMAAPAPSAGGDNASSNGGPSKSPVLSERSLAYVVLPDAEMTVAIASSLSATLNDTGDEAEGTTTAEEQRAETAGEGMNKKKVVQMKSKAGDPHGTMRLEDASHVSSKKTDVGNHDGESHVAAGVQLQHPKVLKLSSSSLKTSSSAAASNSAQQSSSTATSTTPSHKNKDGTGERETKDGDDDEQDSSASKLLTTSGSKSCLNARYENLLSDTSWLGRVRRFAFDVTDHEAFQWFILFFIVLNVITLSFDDFPAREKEVVDLLAICNNIFFGVFVTEAVLLHVAVGPYLYWTRLVNAFDGLILLASIVELLWAQKGSSAMTAFRALRVFKLAKNLTNFRLLLKSIYGTIMQIGNFMLLLALMIYIFALAGQNLFATYFLFHPTSLKFLNSCSPHDTYLENREYCDNLCSSSSSGPQQISLDGSATGGEINLDRCLSRAHFDNFLWSCVTIFQVLTGENWNVVFYDAAQARGSIGSILYFGVVVCVGNFVILNVFLAILMCSFERQSEVFRQAEERSKETRKLRRSMNLSLISRMRGESKSDDDLSPMSGKGGLFGLGNLNRSTSGPEVGPDGKRRNRRASWSGVLHHVTLEKLKKLQKLGTSAAGAGAEAVSRSRNALSFGSPRKKKEDGFFSDAGDGGTTPINMQNNTMIEEFLASPESAGGAADSPTRRMKRVATTAFAYFRRDVWLPIKSRLVYRKNRFARWVNDLRSLSKREVITLFILHPYFEQFSMLAILLSCVLMTFQHPLSDPESEQHKLLEKFSLIFTLVFTAECVLKAIGFGLWHLSPGNRFLHGKNYYEEKKRRREEAEKLKNTMRTKGMSKAALRAAQNFKRNLFAAKKKKAQQSIHVTQQEVEKAEWEEARKVALAEQKRKNDPRVPFFRNGWNYLDLLVVVIGWLDIAFSDVSAMSGLRTLRVFRALRPLRLVSRNPSLKLVVNTLLQSLPELGNLIIVGSIVFLVFGLWGCAYFKGEFYSCQNRNLESVDYVRHQRSTLFLDAGNHNFAKASMVASGVATASSAAAAASLAASSTLSTPQSLAGSRSGFFSYTRETDDTPLCLLRCSDSDDDPQFCRDTRVWGYRVMKCSHCSAQFCGANYFREDSQAVGITTVNGATATLDRSGALALVTDAEPISNLEILAPDSTVLQSVNAASPSPTTPSSSKHDIHDRDSLIAFVGEWRNTGNHDKFITCYDQCSRREHPYFCSHSLTDFQSSTPEDGAYSCVRECIGKCLCPDSCQGFVHEAATCLEQGGKWITADQHFDNLPNAMMTLLEIATTESWVDVMYSGVDSTAPYFEPKRDREQLWSIFFVLFIFFGSFFILNLAVGVIIENFSKIKRETGQTSLFLTDSQKKWVDCNKLLIDQNQFFLLTNLHEVSPFRRRLYALVSSTAFDGLITVCILLNTLCMAVQTVPEPTHGYTRTLDFFNELFVLVFNIEAVLKLLAMRLAYFKTTWNRFDFLCVLVADVGLILELNVGGVFALFLFVYALLGIHLFAKVREFGDDVRIAEHNQYANFRTFQTSVLTLFRSCTGEAWNVLMHNFAATPFVYKSLLEVECVDDMNIAGRSVPTAAEIADGNLLPAGHPHGGREISNFAKYEALGQIANPIECGTRWSFVFWTTYTILITYLILNLFIAVIFESFDETAQRDETFSEIVQLCIKRWKRFDPDCTCYLPLPKALEFVDSVIRELHTNALAGDNYYATSGPGGGGNPNTNVAGGNAGGAGGQSAGVPLVAGVGAQHNKFEKFDLVFTKSLFLRLTPDGRVPVTAAILSVFRYLIIHSHGETLPQAQLHIIHELDAVNEKILREKQQSHLLRMGIGGGRLAAAVFRSLRRFGSPGGASEGSLGGRSGSPGRTAQNLMQDRVRNAVRAFAGAKFLLREQEPIIVPLEQHVAASKLQRHYRKRMRNRRARNPDVETIEFKDTTPATNRS
eukprot:g11784.t1